MWILGGDWQYIIFRCIRRYRPNCAPFWQRVPIVAIPTLSTARQHRVNQIMLKREREAERKLFNRVDE